MMRSMGEKLGDVRLAAQDRLSVRPGPVGDGRQPWPAAHRRVPGCLQDPLHPHRGHRGQCHGTWLS